MVSGFSAGALVGAVDGLILSLEERTSGVAARVFVTASFMIAGAGKIGVETGMKAVVISLPPLIFVTMVLSIFPKGSYTVGNR